MAHASSSTYPTTAINSGHVLYESARVYQETSTSKAASARPSGTLSLVRHSDGAINFKWSAFEAAKDFAKDYDVDFPVSTIYSFKRKNNRLIVVLQSTTGYTYLPPFLFTSGTAVKTFLDHLQVNLASLSGTGNAPTLKRVLDDFNMLVVEAPTKSPIAQLKNFKIHDNKIVNEAKWTLLEGASTVTRFVRQVQEVVSNGFAGDESEMDSHALTDSFIQMQGLNEVTIPTTPSKPKSHDPEHDNLVPASTVSPQNLPRCPPASTRDIPISVKEWREFFSDDGLLREGQSLVEIRRRIFKGGFEPEIRKEGWMFLFGCLPIDDENPGLYWAHKIDEYTAMKKQWDSVTPTQMAYNAAFRERIERVAKDVARTDRDTEYFKDNGAHLESLGDILCTWCMYNFDLGYVQGMSDMAAVILSVVDDEVIAFWCFVGLMDTEHGAQKNFAENQLGMKQNLQDLQVLVKFYDPLLFTNLEDHQAVNMFFAFRWLLVFLKREFSVADTVRVWDVLWSNHISSKFFIFVCLGIIEDHREQVMGKDFDELLQYFNVLTGTFVVEKVLRDGESICKDIARRMTIPDDVKELFDVDTWSEIRDYEERQPKTQRHLDNGNDNVLDTENSLNDSMDATVIATHEDDSTVNTNTNIGNSDGNTSPTSMSSSPTTNVVIIDPNDERDGSWIDVGNPLGIPLD